MRINFSGGPPMKHNPREIRNALFSLIREVGKNTSCFVRNPERDFTRKRKLDMETLLCVLLTMENKPLSCELLHYFGVRPDVVSASAFVQQRAKLLPEALEYIFRRFSSMFHGDRLYRGYRLLAMDGSDVQIPTDPTDAETFFPGSRGQKSFNITKIATLYDLLNHTYADALVKGKAVANENKLLVEMVKRSEIEEPVILTADRNFECWDTLAQLQSKGWNYVIRVKESKGFIAGLDVPETEEFDLPVELTLTRRHTKAFKELCKNRNRYRYIPTSVRCGPLDESSEPFYTLHFRLVRLKLPNDMYEVLVTNLDQSQFPPAELSTLYKMRWGIETSFRELKYTVGLLNFHGKKPAFIRQEIFARIIMYNFTECIVARTVIKKDGCKHACTFNFTQAVYICREIFRRKADPELMDLTIARYVSPVRPGRNYPRKPNQKGQVYFIYRPA